MHWKRATVIVSLFLFLCSGVGWCGWKSSKIVARPVSAEPLPKGFYRSPAPPPGPPTPDAPPTPDIPHPTGPSIPSWLLFRLAVLLGCLCVIASMNGFSSSRPAKGRVEMLKNRQQIAS